MKKRHKIIFGILYVAVPMILAWIGYLVYNFDREQDQTQAALKALTANASKTAYYDLPQLTPSISLGADKTGSIKIDLSLEVSQQDILRLADYEPRILERVVLYLRSKDLDDMQGPRQMRDLREGLEREIRRGAFPIPVIDIVVKQMAFE